MVKNWDKYKELIIRYYIDEKMSLNEVMQVMYDRHAFKASARSYRQKFHDWEIRKYRDRNASSPSDSGSPPFHPPQPERQYSHQSRQRKQHDWYPGHQGRWDESWAKNTGSSMHTPDSDSAHANYACSDMFDLPHRGSPSSMAHGQQGGAMSQPVDHWTSVGHYGSISPPLSVHAAPSPYVRYPQPPRMNHNSPSSRTNHAYPSPGPSQNFQPYPQGQTGYDTSHHTASSYANHQRHSSNIASPWSIMPPEHQHQLREAYLDIYAQPSSHGRRGHASEDYPEDEIESYRRPNGAGYGTTGRRK